MTVRELLARIDSKELSEWMAYYELNPFGTVRDDLQAGIIASTIANVNRGKNDKSFSLVNTPGEITCSAILYFVYIVISG